MKQPNPIDHQQDSKAQLLQYAGATEESLHGSSTDILFRAENLIESLFRTLLDGAVAIQSQLKFTGALIVWVGGGCTQ